MKTSANFLAMLQYTIIFTKHYNIYFQSQLFFISRIRKIQVMTKM